MYSQSCHHSVTSYYYEVGDEKPKPKSKIELAIMKLFPIALIVFLQSFTSKLSKPIKKKSDIETLVMQMVRCLAYPISNYRRLPLKMDLYMKGH